MGIGSGIADVIQSFWRRVFKPALPAGDAAKKQITKEATAQESKGTAAKKKTIKADDKARPKGATQTVVRKDFLGLSFAGFHKVSYQEWGSGGVSSSNGKAVNSKSSSTGLATQACPLICVHGLTRNSHDFDKLAAKISQSRLVVCPDIVGRGQSGWLSNGALYDNIQYNADMNALIARLGCDEVDWLGTSMGGLIGMMLAASENSPIRRLILNDIGPYISYGSLKRIGNYVGKAPEFSDLKEAENYLREIHAPFAPMNDDDWRDMAATGVRENENGKLTLNYDPKIGDPLRAGLTGFDVNLWPLWDMIKCPVLVFRGAESDLLTAEITDKMSKRGPCASIVEIDGAGHAPTLNSEEDIELIEEWLNESR